MHGGNGTGHGGKRRQDERSGRDCAQSRSGANAMSKGEHARAGQAHTGVSHRSCGAVAERRARTIADTRANMATLRDNGSARAYRPRAHGCWAPAVWRNGRAERAQRRSLDRAPCSARTGAACAAAVGEQRSSHKAATVPTTHGDFPVTFPAAATI